MFIDWFHAFVGGALIGLSASLMLIWNGRVTGVSGIISGFLAPQRGDFRWRAAFLLGLLSGGVCLNLLNPSAFSEAPVQPEWALIPAGLLVGFGTAVGSGCTSGHGICGISRLSPRSLIATLVFMIGGICSVAFFKSWGVLP